MKQYETVGPRALERSLGFMIGKITLQEWTPRRGFGRKYRVSTEVGKLDLDDRGEFYLLT